MNAAESSIKGRIKCPAQEHKAVPPKPPISSPLSHCDGLFVYLFVCFVALRPKSTAMVMAGRSVHITIFFFQGKLEQVVNQYFVHILSLVTDSNPS